MNPFFIYGTLMPGCYNDSLWDGLKVEFVGASIDGWHLRDLGKFPGIQYTGSGTVYGTLAFVDLDDYEKALKALDRLEGFEEGNLHSLYLRDKIEVHAFDRTFAAWTYHMTHLDLDHRPLIASGSWIDWVSAKV